MFATIQAPNFEFQIASRMAHAAGRLEAGQVAALIHSPSEGQSSPSSNGATSDRGWIVQAAPRAIELGVEIGMSAAQALARCDSLAMLRQDAEAEKTVTRALHKAIESVLSPEFEATAPGVVTVDLRGIADLPESQEKLEVFAKDAISRLAQACRIDFAVGIAPSPELSLLASRRANPVCVLLPKDIGQAPDTDESDAIAKLPLSELTAPPGLLQILSTWGIRTVGQLVALPRDELSNRLGTQGAALWDDAAGRGDRLLRLHRTRQRYVETRELDFQIDSLEPLLFLLRRLLDDLVIALADDYLVANSMILVLGSSHGQRRRSEVKLPEPSGDSELLFRLLHTHLDQVTTDAEINAVALELVPARALGQQQKLFERGIRNPHRLAETLAQIGAIVGADQVGTPIPSETHRPDAFEMKPFDPTGQSKDEVQPAQESLLVGDNAAPPRGLDDPQKTQWGLPLRRIRPAEAINVTERRLPKRDHDTDEHAILSVPIAIRSGRHRGKVVDTAGPWLLSGSWWSTEGWQTEEWDVELENGGLLRISRRGAGAEWFLEGVYG